VCEEHCEVSVVGLSVTQQTAKLLLGEEKLYEAARNKLISAQMLFDRTATNDEQQEEYDIFVREIEPLDSCLRDLITGRNNKAISERAAKIFDLQSAPLIQFQAGSKKDISNRKKHVGETKDLC